MAKWIMKYYKAGLYTDDNRRTFAKVKWITPEQFKEATGIEYEPQAE